MSSLPAKTENESASYVARYDTGDPYLAFAEEGGPGIKGQRLSFAKGDWAIGADKMPVPRGAAFLMIIPTAMRGWVKWSDTGIVAADVGLIGDGFLMKHRFTLGDTEESEWRRDPAGNAIDPWSMYYSVQLVEAAPPHSDLTFTTQSWGGSLALKEMCRVFAVDAARHPDCYPIVTLAIKTRPHRTYGQIKGPWFTPHCWATVDDVRSGRKLGAMISPAEAPKPTAKSKAKPKAKPLAEELDDALPW
jgi:hypothetical protein